MSTERNAEMKKKATREMLENRKKVLKAMEKVSREHETLLRQIIVREVSQGRPQKKATLTYYDRLPDNWWDEIAEPFLSGKKIFGNAKKTLTINVMK